MPEGEGGVEVCPLDDPPEGFARAYLAVAAHPPASSYHELGVTLIGRGRIIQVWCLVAPFEEAHPHQSMIAYSRRARPGKIPQGIIPLRVDRELIGRPRKIKLTATDDDHAEPSLNKARGGPRKYPPLVAKVQREITDVKPHEISIPKLQQTITVCEKRSRGRTRRGRRQSRKETVSAGALSSSVVSGAGRFTE